MPSQPFFLTLLNIAVEPWVILLGLALTVATLRSHVRRRSLPPGPHGYPIVGNALQLPLKSLHTHLAEWGKIYGTS